jgi:hypothetical protein
MQKVLNKKNEGQRASATATTQTLDPNTPAPNTISKSQQLTTTNTTSCAGEAAHEKRTKDTDNFLSR